MSVPFYLDRFFAPPLFFRAQRSTYVYAGGRGARAGVYGRVVEKPDAGLCWWCGHCSGRLRGALRLSFDVKHVRHEEYVNNANKTLFIARARARVGEGESKGARGRRAPRRRAYFIIVFYAIYLSHLFRDFFCALKRDVASVLSLADPTLSRGYRGGIKTVTRERVRIFVKYNTHETSRLVPYTEVGLKHRVYTRGGRGGGGGGGW